MHQGTSVAITGASTGLGAALAHAFAEAGAGLTLLARRTEQLEQVAAGCRRFGGKVVAVTGDVTKIEDGQRLTDCAVAEHGGIDCLIANAGMSMWAPFEQITDLSLFRQLMEVNYLGAVHCIHPALPYLQQRRGQFVAISSIQARLGVPNHTGYVAAKHALQGFCDTLRMEQMDRGVGVLTVLLHWLRGTELRSHAFGAGGEPMGESRRGHSSESVSLEEACAAILRGVARRERELVIPWKLRPLMTLNAIRPKSAEAIVRRAVHKQDGDKD
jgi:NAD(P)-dependent dehydrogenase (short-subunit alcohol dehydrogenase family)